MSFWRLQLVILKWENQNKVNLTEFVPIFRSQQFEALESFRLVFLAKKIDKKNGQKDIEEE